MKLRGLITWLFPVPEQSLKMKPGERIVLGGLLALGLAALVYFTVDWGPGLYWGRSSLFRHLGFYCPACGGSRSAYNLVRGNLLLAWRCNQLFILSLPLILWGAFAALRAVATGYPLTGKYLHPAAVWGFLGLVLLFTVLRNIPLDYLNCLRPPT